MNDLRSGSSEATPERGTVVGAFGQRFNLRLDSEVLVSSRPKGKKLRPVCGDHVLAHRISGEDDWLTTEVLPRRNELQRPDARGRIETLAANLDLLVVVAARTPKPDWFVVDRYLSAAEFMGIDAIVAFNKSEDGIVDEHRQVLEEYKACGYAVVACSAAAGDGLDELLAAITGEVSILVGQSGVGKSSIINRLTDDTSLRTGAVSEKSGEGKHTTVNAVMIDLPGGGGVIDSPGVRDYAPALTELDRVDRGFRDIAKLASECRFANCRHLREPGCAVKQAIELGTLSERRYSSYKRLLHLTEDLQPTF